MVNYPFLRLREEGLRPLFIGSDRQSLVADRTRQNEILVDIDFDDARKRDWDLLLIPGGELTKSLVSLPGARNLIQEAYQYRTYIAAVGNGILLLAKAGILDGHRCSAPRVPGIETILAEAGGSRSEKPITVDGLIITAEDVPELPVFTITMIEALTGKKKT